MARSNQTKRCSNDRQKAKTPPGVNSTDTDNDNSLPKTGLTVMGRILVVIVFPSIMGFAGLYIGHLESRRHPERKISFDSDFVMPFLLAMALVVVIGMQTRGFTASKVEPLVQWPKVRKKKATIIRKARLDRNDDDADCDDGDDVDTAKHKAEKKND